MSRRALIAGWLVLSAAACGGAEADGGAASGSQAAPAAGAPASSGASSGAAAARRSPGGPAALTRESLVLCPALEEHRAELASMVGLEADPDRPVAVSRSECIVRGTDGGFVRVSLAPAATPSIALHVEGYDSPVSPAPGLGSDAVFVDVSGQPHVVFRLGSLILDVDAESSPAPDRESMLSLGAAVKGILADANS